MKEISEVRCRHGMVEDWCHICCGGKPSVYSSTGHCADLGYTAVEVERGGGRRPIIRATLDVYNPDFYKSEPVGAGCTSFTGFEPGYTPGQGRI